MAAFRQDPEPATGFNSDGGFGYLGLGLHGRNRLGFGFAAAEEQEDEEGGQETAHGGGET